MPVNPSQTCWIPNCKSAKSFSVIGGKSTEEPGKFTPFRLPNIPPFSTTHNISSSSVNRHQCWNELRWEISPCFSMKVAKVSCQPAGSKWDANSERNHMIQICLTSNQMSDGVSPCWQLWFSHLGRLFVPLWTLFLCECLRIPSSSKADAEWIVPWMPLRKNLHSLLHVIPNAVVYSISKQSISKVRHFTDPNNECSFHMLSSSWLQ